MEEKNELLASAKLTSKGQITIPKIVRETLNIEEGEFAGKKLFTQLVFNDGGYGNIKKLYSAIFGNKLPKNCETTDLIDEKVAADVIITEYNGKKYSNIAYAGFSAVDEEEAFV